VRASAHRPLVAARGRGMPAAAGRGEPAAVKEDRVRGLYESRAVITPNPFSFVWIIDRKERYGVRNAR
jgi:hypothetical protein